MIQAYHIFISGFCCRSFSIWIEAYVWVCICICLTVCFADQRPPQIILLIKPTHTYEQHLLDAVHKYSFAHAAYARHMCAETENFSSKTCYFWGTDAHSCTFIHRSIIARAKQWTTKTKSIAMCSMWMWKDLKQKCHCAHPSKVEMQHVNYRCKWYGQIATFSTPWI